MWCPFCMVLWLTLQWCFLQRAIVIRLLQLEFWHHWGNIFVEILSVSLIFAMGRPWYSPTPWFELIAFSKITAVVWGDHREVVLLDLVNHFDHLNEFLQMQSMIWRGLCIVGSSRFLHPLADGLKFILKEHISQSGANLYILKCPQWLHLCLLVDRVVPLDYVWYCMVISSLLVPYDSRTNMMVAFNDT